MIIEQYALMQDMRELKRHLQEGGELVKQFIKRTEKLENALRETKTKLYNLTQATSPAGQGYIKHIIEEIDAALIE